MSENRSPERTTREGRGRTIIKPTRSVATTAPYGTGPAEFPHPAFRDAEVTRIGAAASGHGRKRSEPTSTRAATSERLRDRVGRSGNGVGTTRTEFAL